jgi:homoserine kinase
MRRNAFPARGKNSTPSPMAGLLGLTMTDQVTIQTPGTTSNLGPGYDCLGLALSLKNRTTVRRGGDAGGEPIATAAANAFFSAAAIEPFPFTWKTAGDVPRARGLGSSVTVRLGIIAGLNQLAGEPLRIERLFSLCAELEGHPDNAAPATFGGFVVCGPHTWCRFDVSDALRFVLLIPPFEVETAAARKVLPKSIPHPDAAMSCANACRITAAFAQGKYELLRGAFGDGLHQPYRQPLVPFLQDAITAGEMAGALGGFLSGSGSTICCVTDDKRAHDVAAAMTHVGPPGSQVLIATADNAGLRVL